MRYIFYLLLLLMIAGCGKDLTIDIPAYEPKIVMNGIFEADSTFKVYVSKTRTTGKNEPLTFLKGATVDVFRNDLYIETLPIQKFISPTDTVYFFNSSLRPLAGDKIMVKASYEDLPDAEGTTVVPHSVSLIEIKLKDIINGDQIFDRTANVEVSFKDPPGEKNYYHIKVYTVYEPPYLSPLPYTATDVNAINAAYSEYELDYSYMWDDIFFSGLEKKIIISFTPLPMDATYKIELRSISKEYYSYYRTLYLQQQNSTGPFAEPINLFSNIKNGYGVIAGYSAVSDTIFIPE